MSATTQIDLENVACGTCGIVFAVPRDWISTKRREGGAVHCPNGCKRGYWESEADVLRRELRESKCEAMRERQLRENAEKASLALERKLRRVHRGICPCCKRTFQNLQRHMATKHPEVLPAPEAK